MKMVYRSHLERDMIHVLLLLVVAGSTPFTISLRKTKWRRLTNGLK